MEKPELDKIEALFLPSNFTKVDRHRGYKEILYNVMDGFSASGVSVCARLIAAATIASVGLVVWCC